MMYRKSHPEAFRKLILRSLAIRMSSALWHVLSIEEKDSLYGSGNVVVGYDRKIQLNFSFEKDLLSHFIFFDAPVPAPDQILILQGDRDRIVFPKDTEDYAQRNGIKIEWLKGSDHFYTNTGDLEKIINITRDFLTCSHHR